MNHTVWINAKNTKFESHRINERIISRWVFLPTANEHKMLYVFESHGMNELIITNC